MYVCTYVHTYVLALLLKLVISDSNKLYYFQSPRRPAVLRRHWSFCVGNVQMSISALDAPEMPSVIHNLYTDFISFLPGLTMRNVVSLTRQSTVRSRRETHQVCIALDFILAAYKVKILLEAGQNKLLFVDSSLFRRHSLHGGIYRRLFRRIQLSHSPLSPVFGGAGLRRDRDRDYDRDHEQSSGPLRSKAAHSDHCCNCSARIPAAVL